MKKPLIVLIIVFILLVGGIFAKPYFSQNDANQELSMEELKQLASESNFIPTFTEITIDSPHTYDKSTYAFRGSALIDINNDGVEELWLAGGKGEADSLFEFENNAFRNIGNEVGLNSTSSTAGGAISIDADNDDDVDLFIAREDGIYFYQNNSSTFTESKLDINVEQDAGALSLAAADINNDGFVDLYISTFKSPKKLRLATFNDPNNRTMNIMALNNGDNTFTDITEESGLAFDQNTFQATFADLNNDTWPDLVIATNTDRVYVYENLQDGSFDRHAPLTEFGFWMGMSIADYDNDGDQDVFVSNIGNTIPVKDARGDLRNDQVLDPEWRLLENQGDFQFTSVSEERNLLDYEFAWGAIFTDLNLDGRQDLLVSENYIKWPAHKLSKLDSRLLMQLDDGTFLPTTEASNALNPHFGTTPLTSDFNQDGYPDLVWVNFDEPTRVLLNNGGDNTSLQVVVPDTVEYLGSRIDIVYTDGSISSHQRIVGQGLMTDTTSTFLIGLGQTKEIESATLRKADGNTIDLNPLINDNRIEL